MKIRKTGDGIVSHCTQDKHAAGKRLDFRCIRSIQTNPASAWLSLNWANCYKLTSFGTPMGFLLGVSTFYADELVVGVPEMGQMLQ